MLQNIIQKIREITPLNLRIKVGPILGYIAYIFNIYILKGKKPRVLTTEETVDLIINKKLSIIRFGDGEMSLINDYDLAFQKRDIELKERLKTVLQSNKDGLLICIPNFFGKLPKLKKREFWFTIHHLFRYRHLWYKLISFDYVYGDAALTRPYLGVFNKKEFNNIFIKIFNIWKNEDVILIEGDKSRLGVGNNMFDNVKTLKRILCPSENAYLKYKEIYEKAKKINKNNLILISLGPTAKILAYDLFMLGYRVVDIGHLDMEYEMFLRKEEKIVKVKYKYFNEINERNPEECNDEKYRSQIIDYIK
jgi:glycosyltransferase family protein